MRAAPPTTTRSSVQTRLIAALVAHRRIVLGAVALVSLAFAALVPRLAFDSSVEVWFLEDDPDLVAYHDFLDRFTADEVVVVALFSVDDDSRGIFRPELLDAVAELTARIPGELPWVHRARSLSNVDVFDLRDIDGEQTIVIEPVLAPGAAPRDGPALDALRRRTLDNTLLAGSLVSQDGRVAAIVIELESDANDDLQRKIEMLDALQALTDDVLVGAAAGLEVEVAGGAVLDRAFLEYSQRDLMLLGPLALLVVVGLAFLVFRRFGATLVPLAVVALATLWMFGVMALIGRDIDILSSGLVVLVLAVGVADTVHVLTGYDRELATGAAPDEAALRSVDELLVPCLFTTLTTIAGLLSLTVSDLEPIAWFGRMAAVGVAFAFVLSVTFVPAVLSAVRPPSQRHLERTRHGLLARLLERLGRPSRRFRAAVLAIAIGSALAAGLGLGAMRIGANPMNYFTQGDPHRITTERVDRALGGTTTVEFLVEAPDEGLKQREQLVRIDALERWIARLPRINHVDSPLDAQRELNRLWTDGRPESAVLPDSQARVGALWRMVEREDDLRAMLDLDTWRWARITARVELSRAGELAARIPELEAHLREHYQDDALHVSATGFVKLMANMERYLLSSQIESLLLAFVVVTLMIGVLLRSVRLALFGMIPNLLPILMGLGFMAAAGIALDPGTVMIGSIALGLVVDDTVHFLVRLRRNLNLGQPMHDAIAATIEQTGRPIVVTSVVLAASFAVLALGSSFAPNIYFGLVAALVILFAVVADLIVLPAALLIGRRR